MPEDERSLGKRFRCLVENRFLFPRISCQAGARNIRLTGTKVFLRAIALANQAPLRRAPVGRSRKRCISGLSKRSGAAM